VTASPTRPHRSRKSLGQHFLHDGSILDRIVEAADITAHDAALEVGPGLGALTSRLVQRAGQVVTIELDPALAAALPARLGSPANLTSTTGDARSADIAGLVGTDTPYKMLSNLPYYAANPIIRRFLEIPPHPQLMVVMVQREVAQTMVAKPGKMGILSVAVQYYARPSLICDVPPQAFHPQPKVSSAVVKLELFAKSPVAVADPPAFFDLVRAGFSAPRKQLCNSLKQGLGNHGLGSRGLGAPPEQTAELLESVHLDGRRRAETLSLEEWTALYHSWASWPEGSGLASPGLRQD
jgi:16S rRNA (adenine1518-N6/adenine1519-N6)-dimethyltransferase